MGKTSTKDLVRDIMSVLKTGPSTIQQIHEKTDFDRGAISRYLQVFRDAGLVKESQEGRSKVYSLESCSYQENTYFGLPLESEKEELIDSIYARIKELWQEKSRRPISKLQAQKIVFKLNKLCDLNIPVGWYLYGGITIKPFDKECEYVNKGLPDSVEGTLPDIVGEFVEDEYAYQSKIRQYKEEHNELYLIKEEVMRILHYSGFSKRSLRSLKSSLDRLFDAAPSPGDDQFACILEDYRGMILELGSMDDAVIEQAVTDLRSSFDSIWKLIALYRFMDDLMTHYSREMLEKHMGPDILQQKRESIDVCSEIQSQIPVDEPTDERYMEVKRMLKNIRLEEKEGLKGTTKEKNEELLDKFGLK